MKDVDFRKSIAYWIGAVARANEQVVNAALAPHGVTIRQVQVLACLKLFDGPAQNELAETLGVEPPTLVRVLDRMEAAGWIERRDDPADRRRKLVRATKKVEPVWATIVEQGTAVEARATRGIKKADLKTARQVLERMLANLEAGDA